MHRTEQRAAAIFALITSCSWAQSDLAQSGGEAAEAELDSRRLIGRAHYENDEFTKAAEEFRLCIKLAPDSAIDHFNLAIVLTRVTNYEESLRMLERAELLGQRLLGVHYVRGIAYKRLRRYEDAVRSLERVIDSDPQCIGAYYNLGVCCKYLQRHEDAIEAFKRAAQLAPERPSPHYQLMTLYRTAGDAARAKHHREIFARTKDTVANSERTPEALERSEYTELLQPPQRTGVGTPVALAGGSFLDATKAAGLDAAGSTSKAPVSLPVLINREGYDEAEVRSRYVPRLGGAVALGDYDGDGDLDVYVVNCASTTKAATNRLYRNDGKGHFVDVTQASGVGDDRLGMDAVFGDYNNDGASDLYVVNAGPNVLYRNRGDGTFEDVSRTARVDEPHFGRRAVFVDYDHDNDLDILVANQFSLADPPGVARFSFPDDLPGEFNALLRNNGDETFTDVTDEAGLLVDCARTGDLLFADFDSDTDIDLFMVNRDSRSRLFTNARQGRFTLGGAFSPPLGNDMRAAADADLNRDGKPDLLLAIGTDLYIYTNDGGARFEGVKLALPDALAITGVGRMHLFDYNNDGWLDLLVAGPEGHALSMLAGTTGNRFVDVSARAGLDKISGEIAGFDTGDLDGDGNEDVVLLLRDRGPVLLRNDNPQPSSWLSVRLIGKKVNKDGCGSVLEIAAGGHYQRRTVRDGAVHFGLGDLSRVDVVRVIWPNGVAQSVIRPATNRAITIEERVRVSASCGFLYAYNGTRFELINEILGIGPLGVPQAPGLYHQPDCTELIKIESHQLATRDGLYELRLTEELREIMYADQFTLRVVDHPAGLEVIPNEMFTAPPFPEDKFFAVAEHLPPVSAVDDDGTDVLPLILERDGRFPAFPLTPYGGLAHPHTLTLDLGSLSGAKQTTLFLDGWIYWSDSSTVMAIAQDPRFEFSPLSLEVRDEEGRWHMAIESVGLPTSKGLVVPVDLTGRFLCDDYHIRLSTNLCIYFDRVFVSTGDQAARCRVIELPVARADLHYRGFSRMTRDALGFERFDYARVSPTGSWNPPAGLFTRYGEVAQLLTDADNMYAIFGPGDELSLSFSAAGLPALPPGWIRDFVFYANGWVKDGDLNTKYSESVGPLPFHGMSGYPYPQQTGSPASESYPNTSELRRYLSTYNTRPSRPTIGLLGAGER